VDTVQQIWQRALQSQSAPPAWLIAVTAVVAALLVSSRRCWSVSRHLVTIAHEGAHGFVAMITGRRLSGIRLHSDTSGVTVSSGPPTGAGMIATTAAGYVGPGVIGLGAAALLGAGHAVALLWLTLVLLALLLMQIRNWFGLFSVLVTGFAVLAVSWWAPEQAQSAFAFLVVWFLLLAAPRPVIEMQLQRRRRLVRNSDADQLARLTGVPGIVWVGVFLFATVGAFVAGAYLMTR
jgi:Peptidase M50B-like